MLVHMYCTRFAQIYPQPQLLEHYFGLMLAVTRRKESP